MRHSCSAIRSVKRSSGPIVPTCRWRAAWRRAPCTRGGHHSYLGGLLEHTVAVGTLALEAGQLHPRLNTDLLITAALGGSMVIDGNHFRGASGRSGELGMLRGRDAAGHERQIQNIVSLSALYSRLAAQGIRVSAPHELTDLDESGQAIIDAWVEVAVDTLIDTVLAINCLMNPEAVLIGGRLPAGIVDQIANRLNQRLEAFTGTVPAIAPVAPAAR